MNPLCWSVDSVFQRIFEIKLVHAELPKHEMQLYKPPFSLQGKTVLDVGAYDGDSAKFFWSLGAEKIICIEPTLEYRKLLCESARRYGMNVVVVPERFKIAQLKIPHDFCKVDIEGYEEILLDVDAAELKPTVVEVHGRQLLDRFVKAGWTKIFQDPAYGCCAIINNYSLASQ